jgi:hypothetical protein
MFDDRMRLLAMLRVRAGELGLVGFATATEGDWVKSTGPRGGTLWTHSGTGAKKYQKNKPGGGKAAAAPKAEGAAKKSPAKKATPQAGQEPKQAAPELSPDDMTRIKAMLDASAMKGGEGPVNGQIDRSAAAKLSAVLFPRNGRPPDVMEVIEQGHKLGRDQFPDDRSHQLVNAAFAQVAARFSDADWERLARSGELDYQPPPGKAKGGTYPAYLDRSNPGMARLLREKLGAKSQGEPQGAGSSAGAAAPQAAPKSPAKSGGSAAATMLESLVEAGTVNLAEFRDVIEKAAPGQSYDELVMGLADAGLLQLSRDYAAERFSEVDKAKYVTEGDYVFTSASPTNELVRIVEQGKLPEVLARVAANPGQKATQGFEYVEKPEQPATAPAPPANTTVPPAPAAPYVSQQKKAEAEDEVYKLAGQMQALSSRGIPQPGTPERAKYDQLKIRISELSPPAAKPAGRPGSALRGTARTMRPAPKPKAPSATEQAIRQLLPDVTPDVLADPAKLVEALKASVGGGKKAAPKEKAPPKPKAPAKPASEAGKAKAAEFADLYKRASSLSEETINELEAKIQPISSKEDARAIAEAVGMRFPQSVSAKQMKAAVIERIKNRRAVIVRASMTDRL